VLLNYLVSRRMKPLTIDFESYKGVGGQVLIPSSTFEREVQGRLNISTKVVSIVPDTLSYVYSSGECRRVGVKAVASIKTARQYYLSDTIIQPDSVLVYAPRHILDTITSAATIPIEATDLSETAEFDATLVGVHGAKFVPDHVKLTFKVDVYTEKTIEVPVTGVDFPADVVLRTFPSTVKVTFQAGLDKLKDIQPSDFLVSISYGELMETTDDKFAVRVSRWPSYAGNVRVSPEKVDFLLERKHQ
jgi:hypothetical protein